MPTPSAFADRDAVERAVDGATSYAKALTRLGRSPARKNYDALTLACERFGLQAPPLRKTRSARASRTLTDDDQVRGAVESSRTWAEALGRLGMTSAAGNRWRLSERAQELGIRLSPDGWRTEADQTKNLRQLGLAPTPPDPRTVGEAHEEIAAGMLRLAGMEVLRAPNGARYDLACVRADGSLARLQVKAARLNDGVLHFGAASGPGRFADGYNARPYVDGEIDYFAVLCVAIGRLYLVPIDAVSKGSGTLRLVAPLTSRSTTTNASEYEVADIGAHVLST